MWNKLAIVLAALLLTAGVAAAAGTHQTLTTHLMLEKCAAARTLAACTAVSSAYCTWTGKAVSVHRVKVPTGVCKLNKTAFECHLKPKKAACQTNPKH